MRVATGTYTGNGTDNRAITGLGFEPDVVMLFSSAPGRNVRTASMAGDLTWSNGSLTSGRIKSLDSDGFTVGSADPVNETGHPFVWVALGNVATGSYTGNGTSPRNVTGFGIDPQIAFVLGSGTDYYRTDVMSGGAGFIQSNGRSSNLALIADGITVAGNANTNAAAYYWWAAEDDDFASFTYTGNATDNRQIDPAVDGEIHWIWIQDTADHRPVVRASAQVGDLSVWLTTTPVFGANYIQSIDGTTFEIGTEDQVNESGFTFEGWVITARPPVSVAGAQPAPSGALDIEQSLARSVAGAPGAPAGELASEWANKQLAGEGGEPSATLFVGLTVSLGGVQGAPLGTVAMQQSLNRVIAGLQEMGLGVVIGPLDVAVAGAPGAPSGVLTVFEIGRPRLRLAVGRARAFVLGGGRSRVRR